MLDVKWIVNNLDDFRHNLKIKQLNDNDIDILIKNICELYAKTKELDQKLQFVQHERHLNSDQVKNTKDIYQKEQLITKGKEINGTISVIECKLNDNKNQLEQILGYIPNILDKEVPVGKGEEDNLEIKRYEIVGNSSHKSEDSIIRTHIVNNAGAKILDHTDILKKFNLIEVEKTVAMSGTRFTTLKHGAAKLERALINFMLDINTSVGFKEYSPPYLVHNEAMYKAGHLPKFSEDSFETTDNRRLIPTSEVCLVNFVADEILNQDSLPYRMTACTPCFRSEAGSTGRDTKGLIRLHQFTKIELITICEPEKSEAEHQLILNTAQKILQTLDLPYRVMLLCSGDTGLWSAKTYDIEVWFPHQGKYREISSCSNCSDYQARRLKARYKNLDGKNILLHTLNGSSLPIGRTLAAIVENYMDYDNNYIRIPTALIPYFGSDKLSF